MFAKMNDSDFEEKLLLNSLGNDHHNHHQRFLNNHNHIRYHSHHHHRVQYQQQYFEDQNYHRHMNHHHRQEEEEEEEQQQQQHRCEQPWNKLQFNQVSSIVSMSTEEDLLDNFNLELFEGEQTDIVDINTYNVDVAIPDSAGNTIQKSEKFPNAPVSKLSRKIATDASKDDAKANPLPANNPQQQPRPQRCKSSPSRRKTNDNDNDNDNDKQSCEPRFRVGVTTNIDILCGQSRVCASHPGNRTFQMVLEDFAHKYDSANSKQEKMHMTKAVVSIIHDSGGRFLKYKNEMWEEISIVAARDKVSHALRTKVASWKRQRQQQDQQQHILSPRSRNGGRKSLSRSSNSPKQHRRSGINSPDNINPVSFDGNDASSTVVVNGLIQAQQELFAKSIDNNETDNHNCHHNNNNNNINQHPLYHHRSQESTTLFRRPNSHF